MHPSTEQIKEMKRQATQASDEATAKLCDAALVGDRDARTKLEQEHPELQTDQSAVPT